MMEADYSGTFSDESQRAGGDGSLAALILKLLHDRGLTIGVAESLTGGQLVASLIDVPGASAVVRGGIVAYATDLKAKLLGVSAELLAAKGPVDPDVAAAMARGVCAVLGSSVGVATTGVAGPEPQNGIEPGVVYTACHFLDHGPTIVNRHVFLGERAEIRTATVQAVLAELDQALAVCH